MEISPISSEQGKIDVCSGHGLQELCANVSDPESEIEIMLTKNSWRQKKTAFHLQKAFMKERTQSLEKAFAKMDESGSWKTYGYCCAIAAKIASTVIAHYADKSGLLAKACAEGINAAASNNPLEWKAEECRVDAQKWKFQSGISGMRRDEYTQWLKDTRSMENKMLDHIESMDAKKHEGKKVINEA